MKKILITPDVLTKGTSIISGEGAEALLTLPANGGGIELPQIIDGQERYLTFTIEVHAEHSAAFELLFFAENDPEDAPTFGVRFGVLPRVATPICIDLNWTDGSLLFPGSTPGELKVVCHGGRIDRGAVRRVVLTSMACYQEQTVLLRDMTLADEAPGVYPLPDIKLIDRLGQSKQRTWPGKVRDIEQLEERLAHAADGAEEPFPGRTRFGGCATRRLREGTGFFTRHKTPDGRWWLVDPEGCAFFSTGPDCVVARSDCRVDGVEQWMDWLPDRDDPVYGPMYEEPDWPYYAESSRRHGVLFSFEQANLYRVFGPGWYEQWMRMMQAQLVKNGFNTLGNWSDDRILGKIPVPYVTSLAEFPRTEQMIFRDFPDVFSEEYRANAKHCAQSLAARRDDPFMIGYFLRNEPAWAFVDHLVIADEVLYNPARTSCREELVATLRLQYGDIASLSRAWEHEFQSFDDLYQPWRDASKWSAAAHEDLHAFSRRMLEAYAGIPSQACRAVDSNHMILGMRWAWISDPDVVTGWENFDVFSINCYAVDPTPALDNVKQLGVDLPIMIGEFHFGALDAGNPSTGLEGVASQEDRAKAYRYYCERVAAHPNGVGCHFFQCYDQFPLGRFDGENYNIGLFDLCSQPYPELMAASRACAATIYDVAAGELPPTQETAKIIPMVAF